MNVLTLDLATKIGICWGPGDDGLPRLRHHELPSTGPEVGRFLASFRGWFRRTLDEVQPALVVFEAPVLTKTSTTEVTRKLHALPGMAELECYDRSLPCRQAFPHEWKKSLVGKGNAKKFQVVAACRAYGLDPHSYGEGEKEASDEADAFGLWIHTIREWRPELRHRWAPLFFGARP